MTKWLENPFLGCDGAINLTVPSRLREKAASICTRWQQTQVPAELGLLEFGFLPSEEANKKNATSNC